MDIVRQPLDLEPARPAAVRARVRGVVREFSPAYFAMVMATGIVSHAAAMLGVRWLALGLLWLGTLAYFVIWGCYLLRLVWFAGATLSDLVDHRQGPGFFTSVAATCILGSQFVVISPHVRLAIGLWLLGNVLWLLLTYTIFAAFATKERKPTLYEGISGAWLLAVVATQAVASLSALIALHWDQPYRLMVNFFGLSMWLWGGMLYIWMIALIFYRYMFFPFSPSDLSPPYWINMGAMAISTLAGARLIGEAPNAPFLQSLLPFLKGFTVFYWVTGTWWIPMLVVLAVWRHVYKRFPLRYDPLYWGAVFPLGMYSVGTYELARVMNLDFLVWLPRGFAYIALLAWLLTFGGFCRAFIAALTQILLPRRRA